MRKNRTHNKRILIVEVNWLGDVLFSTAALRALRTRYPQSFIACLLHPRCQEVLTGNPHINELLLFDEENTHRGLLGKRRLIRQLQARHFDTVYLFHRSFTRTLLCFLSGIPHRIGYRTMKRRFLLTEALASPKGMVHRVAYYLNIVTKEISHDAEQLRCDFFINENDVNSVRAILEKENIEVSKKVVAIHPAGNWPPKRWPQQSFFSLADELIMRYDCTIIFTGADKERFLVEEIVTGMQHKAINLCGRLSLKQLGALFKRANLIISGDSGPLHIAVALGRPTIALFGPTSPMITGPLATQNVEVLQKDMGCEIPCYIDDCLDNRCMSVISVDDVIKSIEKRQWLK